MNQNILEETADSNLQTNSRTKLAFLQSEKIRLQVAVREMQQQIKLQRAINRDLAKGCKEYELIDSLRAQNDLLEQHYLRIKNQNQQLTSTLLIHQQLMDSNQFDLATSLRSYQQKIIELRRSIQHKESAIQTLQSKLNLQQERIVAPSNNVTLLFFHEIEELKTVIGRTSARNKELQFQNKELSIKNQQLAKKMNLLESLALKSQLTYEEFKHYYNSDSVKTRNSAPKRGVHIPLKERLSQLSLQKSNEIHNTRQSSQYSSLAVNSSVKMLVYKDDLSIQKLRQELCKLREQIKYEHKSKNMISQSYSQLQNKLAHTVSELNYYKRSTQDLAKIITYKRQLIRSKSLQRSKEQTIIDNINIPSEITYVTDRKKYWTGVQSNIKIQKIKLLQIKRKYNKMYRSLSCATDYRRLQSDGVDRYLNKKNNNNRQRQKSNMQDFSRMIEAPFEDDFSIIKAVSSKKTYSQWKKTNQNKNAFNLTVIEQNIL